MNFQDILNEQTEFFNSQKTKNMKFRKRVLQQLKEAILKNEDLMYEAIYKDFGKSKFDTFTTEISFVLKEIEFYLKNLTSLSGPKKAVSYTHLDVYKRQIINKILLEEISIFLNAKISQVKKEELKDVFVTDLISFSFVL